MKSSKRKQRAQSAPAAAPRMLSQPAWFLGLAAAALATVIAYWPAIRAEFVFDDFVLPFTQIEFAQAGLSRWLAGTRPVLMLSFWANFVTSGLQPFAYHLTNVVLHLAAGLLVFVITRRLLGLAGEDGARRDWLAVAGASLFLLHPIQTESVAYVASRSELLSVSLCFAAFAVFLHAAPGGIGWFRSLAVLVLFGAAVTTKEHVAVMPALFLLADYYWNPAFSFSGMKRNWRLYGMMAVGAAGAGFWVARILGQSDTAGLGVKGISPYEYFLTQGRVIWMYLRLYVLPVGQNVDHDIPLSRGPLEGGAMIGIVALAAVLVAAIVYRKKYPLGSFGTLVFLLLLAPTSSFLPILDVSAERRMYLPSIGLILVVLEIVRRLRVGGAVLRYGCAGVLGALFLATFARAGVWSNALSLWEDSVSKSPGKYRPEVSVGQALRQRGRCKEAIAHFEAASRVGLSREQEYTLLLDRGLAHDCAGDPAAAIERLKEAASISRNGHVYSLLGYVYGKHGRNSEALEALDTAEKLAPNWHFTYVYRGNVYAALGEHGKAEADFRRALALEPGEPTARRGLAAIEARRNPR